MILQINKSNNRQIWTINHPSEGNSLGNSVYLEMDRALSELEEECLLWMRQPSQAPETKVLVITAQAIISKNNTIWIAGGDLKELSKITEKEDIYKYSSNYSNLCYRLLSLPIPVIMAIDGLVVGGGAELAAFGDIRFMTKRSFVQLKQLYMGLSFGYGSHERLVELIGYKNVVEWTLTGDKKSADDCLNAGFANYVIENDVDMIDCVERFIEKISTVSSIAFASHKRVLNKKRLCNQKHLDLEIQEFSRCHRA